MSENCEKSGTRVWRRGEPVDEPVAPGAATEYELVTCPGCGQRVSMRTRSGRLAEHGPAEQAA